jgi:hypothetical protein
VSALDRGAIAILDVLGFKGIWGPEDPGTVLDCLVSSGERGFGYRAQIIVEACYTARRCATEFAGGQTRL